MNMMEHKILTKYIPELGVIARIQDKIGHAITVLTLIKMDMQLDK